MIYPSKNCWCRFFLRLIVPDHTCKSAIYHIYLCEFLEINDFNSYSNKSYFELRSPQIICNQKIDSLWMNSTYSYVYNVFNYMIYSLIVAIRNPLIIYLDLIKYGIFRMILLILSCSYAILNIDSTELEIEKWNEFNLKFLHGSSHFIIQNQSIQ